MKKCFLVVCGLLFIALVSMSCLGCSKSTVSPSETSLTKTDTVSAKSIFRLEIYPTTQPTQPTQPTRSN